jgi:PhzF family phenazine biosynthesis protein
MRVLHIDAFTDRPFKGNPAAVVLLDREREATWMQQVGAEMNLSETAFLLHRGDDWSLRWFTPTVEVDLCGHATLASAHALWSEQLLDPAETARFQTRSGLLTASLNGNLIELDFPITLEAPADPPAGLLEALGVKKPLYVGKNKFDYLVEVESEDAVRALKPDHARLRQISVRGVIVTSRATNDHYDFVSRFFAPGSGIDEDPVTGSSHCCLTPYWAAKLGKNELVAYQASPRGGFLHVRVNGDRVKLGGRAVTILRGRLEVSVL